MKSLISQGLKNLIVTGTCFEFGKKYGPLSPTTPTLPENPYAVAKDELRKWLTNLSKSKPLILNGSGYFICMEKARLVIV